MDLLNSYDDDETPPVAPTAPFLPIRPVIAAPAVARTHVINELSGVDPCTKMMQYNVPIDALWAPVAGPVNPYNPRRGLAAANHFIGHVEADGVDGYAFDEQRLKFNRTGVAMDPSQGNTSGLVMTNHVYSSTQDDILTKLRANRKTKFGVNGFKCFDLHQAHDIIVVELAPPPPRESNGEEADTAVDADAAVPAVVPKVPEKKKEPESHSTLHIKKEHERDYMGRSWLEAIPADLRAVAGEGIPESYLPKTCVHQWEGHTKGVNCIRWLPKWGHLLLSASLDNTVKIWDVSVIGLRPCAKYAFRYTHRKCVRTYNGHTQGVRSVTFNNDGTQFYSTSYDKLIRLWDTETGQVVSTLTTGKVAYNITIYPPNENIILTPMHNKKTCQWDVRANEVTMEYGEHLGPVNTATLIDDDRRLATTSDDKKMYIWEFGIPVVMKHISEPFMHSMPVVTVHPNKKWMLCQSLDNQILCYGSTDRFKLHKKKLFRGHNNAGFACGITTPPDGAYVCSGDADGRVFIWDWKSCKIYKKFQAHEKACMGVEWHPVENSKLASAGSMPDHNYAFNHWIHELFSGWDGLIKFWD